MRFLGSQPGHLPKEMPLIFHALFIQDVCPTEGSIFNPGKIETLQVIYSILPSTVSHCLISREGGQLHAWEAPITQLSKC